MTQERRWVEPAALLALVCLALVLTTAGQGGEFFRDEDVDHPWRCIIYADALGPLESGSSSAGALIDRVANLLYYTAFSHHGALPYALCGMVYRAYDVLGIPFGYAAIQLPTALFSVLTVAFFFSLLRRAGIDHRLAALGTVLLCISPLFLGQARGISTLIWTVIPFQHVFALWALQGLALTPHRRWPVALAMLFLTFGDAIFYLFLLAVAVAFVLRDVDWSLGAPKVTLSGLVNGARPLGSWIILAPLVLGATVQVSAYIRFAVLGELVPIPMLAALHKRNSFAGWHPNFDDFSQAVLVLLGMGGSALFVAALVILVVNRIRPKGFVFTFAILATLGYGFVMYAITIIDWGKVNAHQVYLIVPTVLFIVSSLAALVRLRPRFMAAAIIGLIVGIAFTGASTAAYVWHRPLPFHARVSETWTWGADRPTLGVKAAGYLVRQYILSTLRSGDATDFDVFIFESPDKRMDADRRFHAFRIYSSPIRQYGALLDGGGYFFRATGTRPNIKTEILDRSQPSTDRALVLDRLPTCETPFCVAAAPQNDKTPKMAYTVRVDGEAWGTVFLPVARIDGLAAGAHDAEVLGAAFDRTYTQLDDYFATSNIRATGHTGGDNR